MVASSKSSRRIFELLRKATNHELTSEDRDALDQLLQGDTAIAYESLDESHGSALSNMKDSLFNPTSSTWRSRRVATIVVFIHRFDKGRKPVEQQSPL